MAKFDQYFRSHQITNAWKSAELHYTADITQLLITVYRLLWCVGVSGMFHFQSLYISYCGMWEFLNVPKLQIILNPHYFPLTNLHTKYVDKLEVSYF